MHTAPCQLRQTSHRPRLQLYSTLLLAGRRRARQPRHQPPAHWPHSGGGSGGASAARARAAGHAPAAPCRVRQRAVHPARPAQQPLAQRAHLRRPGRPAVCDAHARIGARRLPTARLTLTAPSRPTSYSHCSAWLAKKGLSYTAAQRS
jgi:hypothetical protein